MLGLFWEVEGKAVFLCHKCWKRRTWTFNVTDAALHAIFIHQLKRHTKEAFNLMWC